MTLPGIELKTLLAKEQNSTTKSWATARLDVKPDHIFSYTRLQCLGLCREIGSPTLKLTLASAQMASINFFKPSCQLIDWQTFTHRSHQLYSWTSRQKASWGQRFPCPASLMLLSLNKTPKGIMRSAVPLPCLFDVVKCQRVEGQWPRQGTKSCRMGRNSVRPFIRPWTQKGHAIGVKDSPKS